MTAPTINGTRYPQPVDELLPAARKLELPEGQALPSRNRLMREFRIGAPKADELLARLREEKTREAIRQNIEQERSAQDEAGAAGDPAELVQAAGDLAQRWGHLPTGAVLAEVFGIDVQRAEALRGLVQVAHRQGSALDRRADEPAVDPWDYARPIGPDPMPAPVVPEPAPPVIRVPVDVVTAPEPEPVEQVTAPGHPGTPAADEEPRRAVAWPVILLALPAFVAIWSGWVGLGGLTGFGVVHPLPGIADSVSLNTAITLPIGVETYGAYALYVWLSGRVPPRALRFAKWSAIGSLVVGALGQVAYHLLVAAGWTSAPWWITTLVSCLPVAVLGMGAALAHLVREDTR
ncbi:ABC transporter permease [Micromonospora sp. NPDC049033]|uniref:ABC transporter permease n=1 Tax=Micromonospora sp. NPDC049033 TaxID=3155149 RepID=UPI0033E6A95C